MSSGKSVFNVYHGRVISISCLKVTPFWHGCHEIKFRNMGRKKILNGFLESLLDFKNLCRSRFLKFVFICDLKKSTPKWKNIQKRRKHNDKMLEIFIKIKNSAPKSKSPTMTQIKKLTPGYFSTSRQHSKNMFTIFLRFL